MVYKKYHLRGGKKVGPYYYESYRDSSGKVKRRYLGTTNPYESVSENVFKRKKVLHTNFSWNILLIVFIGLLILITFFVTFSLLNNHFYYSKTTGFVIVGNDSQTEMEKILLENENVETSYNSSGSGLLIKTSERVSGIVTKNKNKLMDFSTGRSKIRLYFDLMNYSKFVEGVTEITDEASVFEDNLVSNNSNSEDVNDSGYEILSKVAITGNVVDESVLNNIGIDVGNLNQTIIDSISENSVVNAENFDVIVNDSKISQKTPEYKWGYKVRLNELKFMAKIDVTSNEQISIYNNDTLKIGRNLMSFSDLEKQGYKVRFEKPSFVVNESSLERAFWENKTLNENESFFEGVVNDTIINDTLGNFTDSNKTEVNITIVNETINNIFNESENVGNGTEINESEIIDNNIVNESKSESEESQSNGVNNSIDNNANDNSESGNEVSNNIGGESGNQEINNNNNNNNNAERGNNKESSLEKTPEKTKLKEEIKDEKKSEKEASAENPAVESDNYVTGNIIKFFKLSGKAIVSFTGKVIYPAEIVEEVRYENSIVVYIERDFSESIGNVTDNEVINSDNIDYEDMDNSGSISIGDIINLDPSLIIIPISDAEHLNHKREFISNVYESVRNKDNNWSEEIKNKEYLRVIFEKNLSKGNDITVYARKANNNSNNLVEIEVYKQDSNNLLARFENISAENWYKVYLNNLSEGESSDVFDLRVVGNSVEFDYIVDPSNNTEISFIAPTPTNATSTSNTSFIANVSIVTNLTIGESDDYLTEVKWSWNGTNYTMYNNSLILMFNFDNLSVFGENGTSNFTYDASNYSNNGTCVNMSAPGCNWTTSGKYNKGIIFDGSDDYVNVSVTQTKTSHSLWYKNSSASSWSFVAYNGSKFFINGAQGNPNQYPLNISGNVVKIGYNYTGNESFNGTIDEIRIWSYALSSNEVYQQYVSNLQKLNYTQWYLYVNQSKNATAGLDVGNYTYFAGARNVRNNENITDVRTIIITAGSSDTTYPLFSGYWDNNGSLIGNGTGLFNVTLLNTNGTVFLEINNTNITAGNLSVNVYNASYNFTSNGTYNYKWISYGNVSSRNLNVSNTRGYVVNSSVVSDIIVPNVTLISPVNGTNVTLLNNWFAANFSDDTGLKNATLYIWNSSNSVVNMTTVTVNGTSNSSNISIIFSYGGSFKWNYYVCDNSSNCAWNNSNYTFNLISYPKLYLENILVCENSNLLHVFNVSDISNIQSYSVSPSDVFNIDYYDSLNSTLFRYMLFSGNLTKANAGGANNQSKNYSENITMINSNGNSNSSLINITVIEINHAPVIESISAQSVVAGNVFYKQLSVNDSEGGNETSGNLTFNINFTNVSLFNISSNATMYFTTNSSYIGSHNITVCAIDKGINAHSNISLCGQNGSNLSTCRNFILTITSCGDGSCNNGETCSSCAADCGECSTSTGGGGGGGGGGSSTISTNVSSGLNIEPSLLQVTVKKGEAIQKTLSIKNSKNSAVNMKFSISSSLNQFASIPSDSMTINPGEEKSVNINFFSHETTSIGVYTGKIIVDIGGSVKEIPVVINVNDRKSLFDIGLSLDRKNIKSGQDLSFNLNLFNLGETGRVDAIVEYLIKDFNGNTISKKEETVAVETRASLNNKMNIPLNLVSGKYSIAAIIKYGNFSGVSSDTFEVVNGIRYFFVMIFILVVLILGIVFYFPIRAILNRKAALNALRSSLSSGEIRDK